VDGNFAFVGAGIRDLRRHHGPPVRARIMGRSRLGQDPSKDRSCTRKRASNPFSLPATLVQAAGLARKWQEDRTVA
jgi:hypothetical protein